MKWPSPSILNTAASTSWRIWRPWLFSSPEMAQRSSFLVTPCWMTQMRYWGSWWKTTVCPRKVSMHKWVRSHSIWSTSEMWSQRILDSDISRTSLCSMMLTMTSLMESWVKMMRKCQWSGPQLPLRKHLWNLRLLHRRRSRHQHLKDQLTERHHKPMELLWPWTQLKLKPLPSPLRWSVEARWAPTKRDHQQEERVDMLRERP